MATLILPAHHDAPFYDFEVDLEGRAYAFEFRWNERAAAWFMTVRDSLGNVLAAGRKVVLGAGLLGRTPDPRLPPGGVVAIDTSGRDQEAGRYDLGERVVIAYFESTGA